MLGRVRDLAADLQVLSRAGRARARSPVPDPRLKLAMQGTITVTLLCTSIYVLVLDGRDPLLRELAAAWIGALVGYWLGP